VTKATSVDQLDPVYSGCGKKGIDYFENSRRATLAQRKYAIDNPRRYRDYGDGTIAPYASAGSIVFAPEICISALKHLRYRYGHLIWTKYGFLDSFNRTFVTSQTSSEGWVDRDYLGIDQGPLVVMLENQRTGLVWETMKKNPYIVTGLRRAGFRGGWLENGPPKVPH
jgi:hypothetical protein